MRKIFALLIAGTIVAACCGCHDHHHHHHHKNNGPTIINRPGPTYYPSKHKPMQPGPGPGPRPGVVRPR
ncbi:MAG: hypothetical protein K5787_15015 [Lentisphaeria bacterium]|nr:hypothetical protein [Victivallales bacterium]MCR4575068.1 hypothetical protein [Lentisphaeria bacterium]